MPATSQVDTASLISGFYSLSVAQRWQVLQSLGVVDGDMLSNHGHKALLNISQANAMIENVIGVFGLPLALGLNFLVNGRMYHVPMVVEEASVVAGISSAAKLIAQAGGFDVKAEPSLLIGQIQIVGLGHAEHAKQLILQHQQEILALANSLHPNMVARGGGAKALEIRILPAETDDEEEMLIVHLLVDTCDAMGANVVNTMCEGVAQLLQDLSKGRVFLRILSNYSDRSMVSAEVLIPCEALASAGFSGEEVRDGIISASRFAAKDPYRAATHNKGIMNGIDAVAIAMGNDWRALEAAAHTYAARGSHYTSLSHWRKMPDGALHGSLWMPLKVGTVGGNLKANPSVRLCQQILDVSSASELASVMAAVGLAQNLAAIKALATVGIQHGHMSLHARSVVASAQIPETHREVVMQRLLESQQIKIWKAQEIYQEIQKQPQFSQEDGLQVAMGEGFGKALLIGEHAVVYGHRALGLPICLSIKAQVIVLKEKKIEFCIVPWHITSQLCMEDDNNPLKSQSHQDTSWHRSLRMVLRQLKLTQQGMRIEVFPQLPRAAGLGGSAALAVAVIKALSLKFALGLSLQQVNDLAYACEQIAHGQASGVDNTIATYGECLLYRNGASLQESLVTSTSAMSLEVQPILIEKPVTFVIGLSGIESLTAKMVAEVRAAKNNHPKRYETIFSEIDALAVEATQALRSHRLTYLGELMNINQGLLNALQVSHLALEEMISIARRHGALGAKLTGAGGGGAMLALCMEHSHAEGIIKALHERGYQAFVTNLPVRQAIDKQGMLLADVSAAQNHRSDTLDGMTTPSKWYH